MDYQIALAPDLGLRSADFVADWNATDKARAMAEARLAASSRTSYDPFLSGTVVVLSSIGLGVATNAIYDLIKHVIINRRMHKHIHISQFDQPDGTHILLVDVEEKEEH